MSEPAVILQDASVRVGRTRILADISIRLERGTLVGVVGPNGAGKTALLTLLNGVRRASSGRVCVLGEEVGRLRGGRLASLRRHIGYVPQLQSTSGLAPIRMREVVEMGRSGAVGLLRRLSREDRAIADHWMDRLGVSHLADRLYRDLSGGERRKTHLARALTQQPRLLLLDEPTGNLDPRWQTELSAIVEAVWREIGLTVLFVTHEPHLLPRSTSRILLMAHGELRGDGPPAEVLTAEALEQAFEVPVEVVDRRGRLYLLMNVPGQE